MKKVYYKIKSNADESLELLARLDHNDEFYIYSYESEGTKFPVTRLDDVKILARGRNGRVYEVHEDWVKVDD